MAYAHRMVGATLPQWPAWVGGTVLGVLVAPPTDVVDSFGLDVVFPAFFAVLLLDELRGSAHVGAGSGRRTLCRWAGLGCRHGNHDVDGDRGLRGRGPGRPLLGGRARVGCRARSQRRGGRCRWAAPAAGHAVAALRPGAGAQDREEPVASRPQRDRPRRGARPPRRAGATVVHRKSEWGASWVTLRDPEGNEFCVALPHSVTEEMAVST